MLIILVLLVPAIGALTWLFLLRSDKANGRPGSPDDAAPRRPVGPEDAARHSTTPIITDRRSRELDAQLERWEREQRARGESTGRDPEASL